MKKIIFILINIIFFLLVQFLFYFVRQHGWNFSLEYQYKIYAVLTCVPLVGLVLSIPYITVSVSFFPWILKLVMILAYVILSLRIGFRDNELKILALAALCLPGSFMMNERGGFFYVFDLFYIFAARCFILGLFIMWYFKIAFGYIGM